MASDHFKQLNRLGQCRNDGEKLLARITNAIEAGELPDQADAASLVSACEMMLGGSDPECRRLALLQGLGMYQKLGGQSKDGCPEAELYWAKRLAENLGSNEAAKQVAEEFEVSERHIKKLKAKHPEAEHAVRSMLGDFLTTWREINKW